MSNDRSEVSDPLLQETVWLKQIEFDKTEADFQKLSLQDIKIEIYDTTEAPNHAYLQGETIWLQQSCYERAEAHYQMYIAGTLESKPAPNLTGTPVKRLHVQETKNQTKKQRQDIDIFEKKLSTNVASLMKNVAKFSERLDDFKKVQQQKVQSISDMVSSFTSAIEACQIRLNDELDTAAKHFNSFRDLLEETESLVSAAKQNIEEENWGRFKSDTSFCQSMAEHFSNLNGDLMNCSEILHCLLPDVSKSNINKIVGEVNKLSLIKKKSALDNFTLKKIAAHKNIKSISKLLSNQFVESLQCSDEGSLEGSGTLSESSENELEKKTHVGSHESGQKSRTKKFLTTNNGQANRNNSLTSYNGQINRNNSSAKAASKSSEIANQADKKKTGVVFNLNASVTPKKRNAQGTQNVSQKKREPFKFKGDSKSCFMNQPGLLGPIPNVQSATHTRPYNFSNLSTMFQPAQKPSFHNFNSFGSPMVSGNQNRFGNYNFNFANQSCGNIPSSSLNFQTCQGQTKSHLMPNVASQQSKLFQHNQNKMKKGTEHYGAQSRNPFHYAGTTQRPPSLVQPSQGQHRNTFSGNMEQQLNEMAQKIQQMHLAASHNFQLQQLMQETERLKKLVSQNQQQDMFQNQFQILINAFMQQQQQQLSQGPQSKIAKSIMYENSQRQRIIQNRQHQLQQQKKHRQQNKAQQAKDDKSCKPLPTEFSKSTNPQASFKACGDLLIMPRRLPNKDCSISKLISFDPQAPNDLHRTGISSMVVLDNIGFIVLADIINSCLKLYEISDGGSHNFVTKVQLDPKPYYMSKLCEDVIVISREHKKISLFRVSNKKLEFLHDITTSVQYYGVSYVRDNVVACAAYNDNRIDLVTIQGNNIQVSCLSDRITSPELITSINPSGSILYLKMLSESAIQLICLSQNNVEEFTVDISSAPSDVWNLISIDDLVIFSSKKSNEIKLISNQGVSICTLKFPEKTLKQPFAMAFCQNGNLYVANDGDQSNEEGHFITTEINLFKFS